MKTETPKFGQVMRGWKGSGDPIGMYLGPVPRNHPYENRDGTMHYVHLVLVFPNTKIGTWELIEDFPLGWTFSDD